MQLKDFKKKLTVYLRQNLLNLVVSPNLKFNLMTTTKLKSMALLCTCLLMQFSLHAQCQHGDQTTYGTNEWIGYAYEGLDGANPPANAFGGTYIGYITQPEIFDYNPGGGAITGDNICGGYSDNFAIRFKMKKTFAAGYYKFSVGGDDGYRLSLDGGATFPLQHWQDHGYVTYSQDFYLNGDTDLVLEFYERGGAAQISFNYEVSVCNATPVTSIIETVSACGGASTLTATGGVEANGGHYQWGTGQTAGTDILWGNSTATLNVSPTTPTWYWVRRYSPQPCNGYGDATFILVNPATNTGSISTDYGDNEWKVYTYTGTNINMSDAVYKGVYTQTTLGFNTQDSWAKNSNPSTAPNWTGCPVTDDNFLFIHRREGFPCGRYRLVMEDWDDDTYVSVNGVQVWSHGGWSGGVGAQTIGTYYLNDNSRIEVKTHEGNGDANARLSITAVPDPVTTVAPVSINGNNTICAGGSTTLTAIGGTLGTNSEYQWGTGTVGSNIIAGETGAAINVSPSADITYWVRINNTFCETYTSASTINVTVNNVVAGSLISASSVICKDAVPAAIEITGNSSPVVKWQYADDSAFTLGVTDIASTDGTLTGPQIGFLNATRYFRAEVDGDTCGNAFTPVFMLTVTAPVTWNGSWSSTPTATSAIIVESNLSLNTSLEVCSCEVKNNAIMAVSPGSDLKVKGKVTVASAATLLLFNKASLIQTDEVSNQGNIEVRRNSSKVKRLDYTLWSSPVQAQQLLAFSPFTLTNRFYEYNTTANQYSAVSANDNFVIGKGYLIRTPNNHPVAATAQEVAFKGVPNNGNITGQLAYTSALLSYNAVGNPYASPIRVADFIDANLNNIEGTLWFWRKTNDSNENRSYSTVTKFGYTANTAVGGENDFAIDPDGVINTGQGFIVKAKAAGHVVFNNSMRGGNSGDQFFRNANQTSRIWLNVTKPGAFSQTMFGYTNGVTTGYDNGYDGLALIDGNLNVYTIAGGTNLAIQARPGFTTADIVALGFKTAAAGTFSFAIDHVDGLFTGNAQAVYIKDNQLNLTHNLKDSSYTFTSDAGMFESRFEVVYMPMETMGTDSPDAAARNVVVYASRNQVNIIASDEIKSVEVYDLLGREVFAEAAIKKENYSTPALQVAQQILAIKITMADGSIATKKIQLN